MTARTTIDRLYRRIDQQAAKIARMEQGKHKSDLREGRQSARITELEQEVAALERANARLVDELLDARAAACPLFADEEDEARTRAMQEIEQEHPD